MDSPIVAPNTPEDRFDTRERAVFRALDGDRDGVVSSAELGASLVRAGLSVDDPRLAEVHRLVQTADAIRYEAFAGAIRGSLSLLERVAQGRLSIPVFDRFADDVTAVFDEARRAEDGRVADYIPQLGRADPAWFGMSLCTVDGQRLRRGDADVEFSVQSCTKPMNYALALELHGEAHVHRHVGREPSGHGFSEITLNHERRPHNPMINAGAIMTCALVRPELGPADRFDWLLSRWRAACGGARVGFANAVYLSERGTADRNFALGYFLQENKAFPAGTDLLATLDFYFQCCAIETSADGLAMFAATLANGGVCPLTGEVVFRAETVRDVLSLMYSCGMYDFSGEFAFTVGLPAKSGVSGGIMVVVPGVMGFATYAPKVDRFGNSVRGTAFCAGLVERFSFHNFDGLLAGKKLDPRRPAASEQALTDVRWAAARGDLVALRQAAARGVDLAAPNYDGRTPLHLAASEGRADVVAFLLAQGVAVDVQDRWGGTPYDDAARNGHAALAELLR